MISTRWSHAALLAVFLPLVAGAQAQHQHESPDGRFHARSWTVSPLEAVLERSSALELTPSQLDRLGEEVERWRAASADPLAVLERHAQARAQDRGAGREAMAERHEAMRERHEAMRERHEGMRERQGRHGMGSGGPGGAPSVGGPEPDPEVQAELREAMAALRELRRDQVEVLQEVLTEEQLQLLREDRASLRGSRMWRGSAQHPGPRRPGRNPRR
jgi:hypothetical protein